jgi:acetyl-CoA acyltransferase
LRETVIAEAVRTPVGKRKGGLSGMHAADLSAVVLNELLERTGVAAEIVDDVPGGPRASRGPRSTGRAARASRPSTSRCRR